MTDDVRQHFIDLPNTHRWPNAKRPGDWYVQLDDVLAYLAATPSPAPTAPLDLEYESRVTAMAVALHEDCRLEWQARRALGEISGLTQHDYDAHFGKAHDLVRRLFPELDPAATPDQRPAAPFAVLVAEARAKVKTAIGVAKSARPADEWVIGRLEQVRERLDEIALATPVQRHG